MESQPHLSQILTEKDVLIALSAGRVEKGSLEARALERFFKKYQSASFRFLVKLLGDRQTAEDVLQDFAVKFLSGKLSGFDAQKGQFRDFLKQVLRNEVRQYWRRTKRENARRQALDSSVDQQDHAESAFDDELRNQLLEYSMRKVREQYDTHGIILDYIAEQESSGQRVSSEALALHLSNAEERNCSLANARTLKRRAKATLARQIRLSAAELLEIDAQEAIDQLLSEVGLLSYCQKTLD